MKGLAVAAAWTTAALGSACSGAGTEAYMRMADVHALVLLLVHGGLAIAGLRLATARRSGYGFPVFIAALIAVHPVWTISAYQGDCGFAKQTASVGLALLSASALGVQVLLARRDDRARE